MTRTNENSVLTSTMIEDIQEEKENIPLCTYCRKSFANYSNLRHHIQIVHLKESKWDCIKCGKICSSKSNLKVHFRTHIRVKPYTCKYCEYDCMHHSSIKDHLTKNHPDKPHTSIEPGYNYNSQAVPEPDEFNSIDFDQEKFVEQQCKQQRLVDNSPPSAINKPKRFRSETNILSANSTFPILPPPTSPFPFWPLNFYHPSYFPAMLNALRLSTSLTQPTISNETKTNRKSFEIEGILNLSKRKNLSDTTTSEEDEQSI